MAQQNSHGEPSTMVTRSSGPNTCRWAKHLRRRRTQGSAIASDLRASAGSPTALTNVRTGLAADAIAVAVIESLHCLRGKLSQHTTRNDWYMALAYTARNRVMER